LSLRPPSTTRYSRLGMTLIFGSMFGSAQAGRIQGPVCSTGYDANGHAAELRCPADIAMRCLRGLVMNVFVLCTGRCGSTTFIRACKHIRNFTSGHETRARLLGEARLNYPDHHIEADNRLSWMLGRLDSKYGDAAVYVHLTREPSAVARSFEDRVNHRGAIMAAYREAILMGGTEQALPRDYADDYVQNVTLNIRHFLKDKSRVLHVALETVEQDFPAFWKRIGAQGNLDAAMAEWRQRSNTGESYVATWQASAPRRLLRKIRLLLAALAGR
jgi:hypothetical protein